MMTESEYVRLLQEKEAEIQSLKLKLETVRLYLDLAQIAVNTQPLGKKVKWECN